MFGEGELERTLLGVAFGAARTMPLVWFVPTFGGPHAPAQVRVGLGLAMAVLVLPRLYGLTPVKAGSVLLIALLLREVLVGLTLGFLASAVFRAAEMAGRLVDTFRGAMMGEVLSPTGDGRTSPVGNLYQFVAVAIFLELGGLGHFAAALARSYDAVPITPVREATQIAAVAALVATASARLLEAAVGLAAPALVALLLADLALGAVGRLAPQVPLYFVGMPLKALGGLGVVLVGLSGLQSALTGELRVWATAFERAVTLWR